MDQLIEAVQAFAHERDWDQFHTPKNLVMALSVEASELLEHFQWLTNEQSDQLTPEQLSEVQDEMGDVLIYLIRLSDRLGVDLVTAASEKLEKAKIKYPADQVRGSAAKYTTYQDKPS